VKGPNIVDGQRARGGGPAEESDGRDDKSINTRKTWVRETTGFHRTGGRESFSGIPKGRNQSSLDSKEEARMKKIPRSSFVTWGTSRGHYDGDIPGKQDAKNL